jgi:ABC-2 type transport system ATP-binding protein
MTQRVGIAQALLHDPDLVILDEPMSGLDPMGRADVRDIMVELAKNGKTIFFSTHIIPDVEVICTRVGMVNHGKFVREGTVQELMKEGASETTEVLVQGVPEGFAFPEVTLESSAGGRSLFLSPTADVTRRLLEAVLRQGGTIVSVEPRQASLEDLVVRLLNRG